MTMTVGVPRLSRRVFLETTALAMGATALPFAPARAAAKYTRYNATSPQGQKALASFAKGIEAMLKLPASDPANWFRNAFVHFMDCPHGNWWFYVWHRAFLGYFEQRIRTLSGDPEFAIPYWDWTQTPQIPDTMFDGALTPTDMAFEPYTKNLAVFTDFIKPTMQGFWNGMSAGQQDQEKIRGYTSFDLLWNDVTGFDPTVGKNGAGISGNEAFATTCAARYLSRDNPKLDAKTTFDVSAFVVIAGLLPIDFYNKVDYLSFTSSMTTSHVVQPSGATQFSVLEGLPHNKVHNYIGGVGPLDPGPYGNMTNFLSPVDPIFFLHHSNMDRLCDLWTRKQQALNLPFLPTGADGKTFMDDPFLFFVDGKGQYAGPKKAGDFVSTDVFEYDYAPSFGEDLLQMPAARPLTGFVPAAPAKGTHALTVTVPNAAVRNHLAAASAQPLMALVTLPRPSGPSMTREFDVIVNAPADVVRVDADSPYYAGTIAFFGPTMPGMKGMSMDATFAVPLPRTLHAFTGLSATQNAALSIRLVPSHGQSGAAPALKMFKVGPL